MGAGICEQAGGAPKEEEAWAEERSATGTRDSAPRTHGHAHLFVTWPDMRIHLPIFESSHLESSYVGGPPYCFFPLNFQLFFKKIFN